MKVFFLDASALAKRFSRETGAGLMDHLFSQVKLEQLCCLMLGAAEVSSVLVRRHNNKLISDATFLQGMTNLRAEIVDKDDFDTFAVDNSTIVAALPLIETHSINSNDAIILRFSVDLAIDLRTAGDDLVLVASDRRLLRAAQAEGLATFDPETQSQADLDALLTP
jgi:predicted nucleic acid-binding protein